MEKKKAVVCTILFVIVFIAIANCSLSVRSADGSASLFTVFAYIITGGWFYDCVRKFYNWLMN